MMAAFTIYDALAAFTIAIYDALAAFTIYDARTFLIIIGPRTPTPLHPYVYTLHPYTPTPLHPYRAFTTFFTKCNT